ncbi:hypothetical protein G7Y89_g5406 [Cudoniella acicularis]|uniref:Uncharacterized protein n=1 Tax=Cudoniella acicularis TaxID=354080 RepID=A0A8H4RPM7_9HELO|nr:hypothetical protein G7Y89_g5406 [Cudoniella acicularis]
MLLHRYSSPRRRLLDMVCQEAARRGCNDLINQILDIGTDANPEIDRHSSISAAAEAGHCSTVALLLPRGASPSYRREDALSEAAAGGHLDIINLLYPSLTDSDAGERITHAFTAAVGAGSRVSAQYILDRGFDLNSDEMKLRRRFIFDSAIRNLKYDMICWLVLDLGFNINSYGDDFRLEDCSIVDAMLRGDSEVVRLLFQLGAKAVNLENDQIHRRVYMPPIYAKTQEALDTYLELEKSSKRCLI